MSWCCVGVGRAVNVNSTVDQPRYGMEQPRVGMAWFWQSEISVEQKREGSSKGWARLLCSRGCRLNETLL